MNYLYFGIIIAFALFISIYFFIKNKKNSKVYITENKSNDDEKEETDSPPLDETKNNPEADNLNENKFDNFKIEIIFYWITQKVQPNKNIDYEILKETIIEKIGSLPEVLEENTTHIKEEQKAFLTEVVGHIEFSSKLKYFIVNKGRKLFSLLKNLFLFSGFLFFVLYQIEIRKESGDKSFVFFLITIFSFLLSFVSGKFSKVFLAVILKTLKPGDYLKIISEPDEAIEKTVKINQLSNNETMFNKTTVFLSKKKLLCESFLSQSHKMQNTINNKLCLYIVIDYLKTLYSKEAYKDYLLEKEIDVLEFICGFNPKAVSAHFELALLYLEKERFTDFYETLLKCRSINGYDWIIESYIKTYEFYKTNCLK